ncbi:MAG: T9SS type A sorting domain-containing protein [Flavobacteriia bacterium]
MRLLVFVLSFCFAQSLGATTYYVNDGSLLGDLYCIAQGNNANSGTSSSAPKASLTNLLSSVTLMSGDVIYVDAGTYSDANLTLSTNGISIIGAGPAKTKFDNNYASSDANRLFTVTGDNVVLQGFYVTEYNRGTGGASAIQIDGALNLQVNNVLCDDNKQGGGSSTIVVTGASTVTFNGGGSSCNAHTSIAGGGINIEGRSNNVTFQNYLFSGNNKSVQAGSGLYVICDNGSTTVTVNQSLFSDNVNNTSVGGGGAFVTGATVNITNSCFRNNESGAVSSSNSGGAISVGRGATINISNCTFTANFVTSSGKGGAIAMNPVSISGGGSGNSTVNLTTCTFSGNTAASGNHIYTDTDFSNSGIVNITNCTFIAPTSGVSIRSNSSAATVTISNSGSPSTSGTAVSFVNTNSPTSLASPTYPVLQGSCYGIVLPIELTDFTGYCENNLTMLNWTTASEHHNDYFKLEHGTDNGMFRTLAIVDGKMNSTERTDYSYTDHYAEPGINYYRLSQTDVDGHESVLKTITVDKNCFSGSDSDMSCWYDQQNNSVGISYLSEHRQIVDVKIMNLTGQLVETTQLVMEPTDRMALIKLSETFSNGMYFLILSNNSIRFSEKFMIGRF